jgi:hypothetical protein
MIDGKTYKAKEEQKGSVVYILARLRVRFPAGSDNFSPLQDSKNGSEANSDSYSVPGVKWPGREGDHLPPYSAEINNEWSCTSIPLYAFMAPTGTFSLVFFVVFSYLGLCDLC